MPLEQLQPGTSKVRQQVVTPEHFASKVAPEAPDVFSTPALGALAEAVASAILLEYLEPARVSVGTQLVVNHTAATPEGLTIEMTVTVAAVEGRRVDFEWTATDGTGDIGHGTHQRFAVDRDRFMAGVEAKRP